MGISRSVVAKVHDYIKESYFEFKSRYYVHIWKIDLGKGTERPYLSNTGFNTPTVTHLKGWLTH